MKFTHSLLWITVEEGVCYCQERGDRWSLVAKLQGNFQNCQAEEKVCDWHLSYQPPQKEIVYFNLKIFSIPNRWIAHIHAKLHKRKYTRTFTLEDKFSLNLTPDYFFPLALKSFLTYFEQCSPAPLILCKLFKNMSFMHFPLTALSFCFMILFDLTISKEILKYISTNRTTNSKCLRP